MSQAEVRQAQTQLRSLGLYNGPIDGIWGPRSRAAAMQFQAQNNMTQSGLLDSSTVQQLRSRSSTAGNQRNAPAPGSQIGETPAAPPASGSMQAPPIENRQPTR